MEMSLECPQRQARPVRGPHGDWKQQEIEALERSVAQAAQDGESLRSVFDRLGGELGRKPNSIRNFYYAQLRSGEDSDAPRALPFETFTRQEVEQLVRSVLIARAQGMSVRACVRRLAGGDHTKMLRYQNKYRSTVRTRPELVQDVMAQLSQSGTPFVSPYACGEASSLPAAPDMDVLRSKAEKTDDPQIAALMQALDHLLDRVRVGQHAAPAQESDAQRRADRLGARCDMLRIALDDEQTRRRQLCSEAGSMVTLVKEFIALPAGERLKGADAFCSRAAERLAAVECAMMEPDPL